MISAIANGYYTLLMLDEQLNISERTVKTWDENIRVLQALKRAGRTNEAAVFASEYQQDESGKFSNNTSAPDSGTRKCNEIPLAES